MKYRIDPKSGNELSILGFGCMRFSQSRGKIDMDKAERVVLKAIEGGVNYFDTAYIYQGSEDALGAILEKNALRDKVFLATKLPVFLCRGAADFDKYLSMQLKSLRTDHIDYYLMHMLNDMELWDKLRGWGIEEWIREKKAQGIIGRVGFSFHGTRDGFLSLLDAFDWDFCQIQYNYSDVNYQAGVTGLRRAAEKGLPVFIMEPLLGGKLAGGLPPEAAKIFREANPELSPAAWALRWLWNQPEVAVVLSRMNEEAQVDENIGTASESEPGMLTRSELETFEKVGGVFRAANKVPCTGCNYCMPCPRGVNIPVCFAAYNASFRSGRYNGLFMYATGTGAASGKKSGASQCVGCGKCEKHCPQNIKIAATLGQVRKRLEPRWLALPMALASSLMLRK